MIVRFKSDLLVVSAESEDERESLVCWSEDLEGCVFILKRQDEQTFRLISAGPEAEARREPINVTSRSLPPLHLISNFAHTPFVLDGRRYASVEAFWQGLKYPEEKRRKEIAPLYGKEAMHAGVDALDTDAFEYGGQKIRVGTYEHWRLMTMACRATFSQHVARN